MIGLGWVQARKYSSFVYNSNILFKAIQSLESVLIHRIQLETQSFIPRILKMRLVFAACFSANLFVLMVNGHQTPSHGTASKKCNKGRVCIAIERLEAKLESLIGLVNKTSTPQPTPPGKLGQSFRLIFN